jgi:hypothetical protein
MAQVEAKQGGDDEAMHFDADYIRALEVGLPPTVTSSAPLGSSVTSTSIALAGPPRLSAGALGSSET